MKRTKQKVILLILIEAVLTICMILSSHPLRIFMMMTLLFCMGLCFVPRSCFETEFPSNDCFQCTAKTIAFLGATAVGVITICSKSSPLYPFNDWVDANVYMTMGRAMLDGKIPYRDLYEHKGFIIYAVHALAALISRTSFLGVWMIEIAAAFFFLYYSLRSLWLFCGKRAYIWIPVLAVVVYTSVSFCHGDSAEELCLPLLSYGLWVGLKAVTLKRVPTSWECFAIGLTSGCILWIKYNLLGFYFGWFAALILLLPKGKRLVQGGGIIWRIIAGVSFATLPWMLWFYLNHALPDLASVYFYDNLRYAVGQDSGSKVIGILWNICKGIQEIWRNHTAAAVLILIGFIYLFRKQKYRIALYFIMTLCFLGITCYMGGLKYQYYALPFSVFAMIGLAASDGLLYCLIMNQKKYSALQRLFSQKPYFYLAEIAIGMLAAFFLSHNTYMLHYQKSELPQYQFRDIILQNSEAALLEYKTMDIGLYTVCDIVPEFRYFCWYNMKKEEIREEQERYLADRLADYVVIMLSDMESEGNILLMSEIETAGYKLVSYCDYFNGENPHVYLLYAAQ